MANSKDLDYGVILSVIGVCAIAFTGLGTYGLAPYLAKKKAQKQALINKPQIPKKG